MWSVLQTFNEIRGLLPSYLDPTALERCALVASRIPKQATSHYLEFRLNSTRQVDFLTFTTSRSIAEAYEQLLGPEPSEGWRENLAVLKAWARREGELGEIPFFSFEYDIGESFVASEPEVSLSPANDSEHLTRHWNELHGETTASTRLGKASYRRLLPAQHREACMHVIDRLYAALPAYGAIPYAPVMNARLPVVAKPYVILPRAELVPFLTKIEWPGSFARLNELLGTFYAAFDESVYIDLTVTDRVHSRLGLVTSQFQQLAKHGTDLAWWRLPDALTRYKEELRGWPGRKEARLDGQRVWIQRWLDTKAVLLDDKVEYKAYLGFSPSLPPLFC